jgi:DNA-binding XRE family transcriptional regulator
MGVAKKRRESLATRKSKDILGTHVPKSKPKPKRKKPKHLAKKLSDIRAALGLSQGGMLKRLGVEDELERDYISKYERGVLEPPLHVLLAYARAVGISTDVLIDDKANLPKLKR